MTLSKRGFGEKLLIGLLHRYFMISRGMTMGVRAACYDTQGRIFLVRHSYISGWHMPGGGIERGETASDALVKELREEGNLELTEPPELFHVYFNRVTSRRDHVVFYRCRNVRQTAARPPDREIVESGFFPVDRLPDGVTDATNRRLVELTGKHLPDDHW